MQIVTPKKAKRDDRKVEPLSSESESLKVEWVYTLEEFENITIGFVPESMDDKWFIFYEAPFLYLHRSWTGFCIFAVRFEPLPEGMRIAEVIVNRNADQYGQISHLCTDDSQSLALLRQLLDYITKPDIPRQIRKRAQETKRTQGIVGVAERMLSGEVGIIEGSRQLVSLTSHTKVRDEEDFHIFRVIDSEADILPTAQSRQYWNKDVLERKDKDAVEYEARVKDAAFEACRKLLDNISGG